MESRRVFFVAHLDVPLEVTKWLVTGLFHLLINGIYWGYNQLILTIDPNFLGHPSTREGNGYFQVGTYKVAVVVYNHPVGSIYRLYIYTVPGYIVMEHTRAGQLRAWPVYEGNPFMHLGLWGSWFWGMFLEVCWKFLRLLFLLLVQIRYNLINLSRFSL